MSFFQKNFVTHHETKFFAHVVFLLSPSEDTAPKFFIASQSYAITTNTTQPKPRRALNSAVSYAAI